MAETTSLSRYKGTKNIRNHQIVPDIFNHFFVYGLCCDYSSCSFTICVKSDQFSTVYQKQWQTSGLKGYKETALAEEYSAKFIFDGNYEPHKRIVLYVNHLSVYPVCLCCQLRTYLHFVSNLRFHKSKLFYSAAKLRSISESSKLCAIFFISPAIIQRFLLLSTI